jgi:cysteine desulfurase
MKIGTAIYLDHQATTPIDKRVLAAMQSYFDEDCGNPHSIDHIFGWKAAKAVDAATNKVATMIGADPDEVIFTSGATEANNLALFGLAHGAFDKNRRRILVSAIEHKCVLATADALRDRLGFDVEILPVDCNGVLLLDAFEDALDERVLLVSVMLVNHEIGSIQPIRQIKQLCEHYGALLHCDGAQAPNTLDLGDIYETIDLLSLSAHKIYGPKGIGALFVNRGVQKQLAPMIHGGEQQRNKRSGTLPTPLCVGMGAAAELMTGDNAAHERKNIKKLRDYFVAKLQDSNWPIHVNGPTLAERHPGNANVLFEGFSAEDILGALQPKLAASTGSACTTGTPEASYVLAAIGLNDIEASSSIRFSLGRYTTKEDIEVAVRLINSVLERLSEAGAMVATGQ